MTKKFLLAIAILSGLFIASSVFAAYSPKGCETDTMKGGELCSWSDGRSWCGNNTLACTVEPTGACPANPTGGTYAFDCNTCGCNLTCTSGYTKCNSSTCTPNCSLGANCATCDTCTSNNCVTCNPGFELISGACTAAPLKLSTLSNVGGFIKQITSPTLTLDSSGNLAPTGDLQLVNNKSIALTAVGTTSLWFGNYNGATSFTYGTGDVASIAVEGDIKGNRICFQNDCRADWASVSGAGVWSRTNPYIYPTTITDNVGIGTTNPAAKLFVLGSGTMSSSADSIGQDATIMGADVPLVVAGNTANLSILSNSAMAINTGGTIALGGRYTGASNAQWVKIKGAKESAVDSEYGGYLSIATHPNGGGMAERMRINSLGNVGVGTTNPTSKLDVSGTIRAFGIGNAGRITAQDTNGGGASISIDPQFSTGVPGIGTNGAFPIALNTNSLERMRITSGGSVGIGTTAPNDVFSIGTAGGIAAPAGSDRTGHNNVSTYLSSDNYALANYGLVNTLISSATLWAGTKNGNIWNGDAGVGNVGIGTTAPQSKLTIVQSTNNPDNGLVVVESNTTRANQIYVGADSTSSYIQSTWGSGGNSDLRFLQAGTETLRLRGGNVGIGITNPVHKLSVAGTSYLNGQITTSLAGMGARCLHVDNSGVIGVVAGDCGTATSTGDNLGDHTATVNIELNNHWLSGDGGDEGVFVKSTDGNVGIGTTNPLEELDVMGNVRMSNIGGVNNGIYGYNSTPTLLFSLTRQDSLGAGSGDLAVGAYRGIGFKTAQALPTSYDMYIYGGKVGIATTTPGVSLEVVGGIRRFATSGTPSIAVGTIGDNMATTGEGLQFGYDFANTKGIMRSFKTGTSYYDLEYQARDVKWLLGVGSVAEKMRITSAGNLGLGTTAPNDIFSIGTAGGVAAPAGSDRTGHNNASTYLSSDDYALTNYGVVKTLIASATSSLPAGVNFWGGTKNGAIWNGDAGAGNVGIGITAPTNKLTIVNEETVSYAPIQITSYYNGATAQGQTVNRVARGTQALPTATQQDDLMGGFAGRGYGTTGFSAGGRVQIVGAAAQAFTDTAQGTYIKFLVTPLNSTTIAEKMRINSNGNVGIGSTNPIYKLDVNGIISSNTRVMVDSGSSAALFAADEFGIGEAGLYYTSGEKIATFNGFDSAYQYAGGLIYSDTFNIGLGTTAPNDVFSIGTAGGVAAPAGSDRTGHNNASTYLSSDNYALANYGIVKTLIGSATSTLSGNFLPLAGGSMQGDINLNSHNITNVNNLTVSKITATTIDPLYNINEVNYSTFAPSISGGVKEEYVGKANIKRKNSDLNEYEYIVNFSLEDEGSDLWLWHKVVDYSNDNVQVFITPAGKFAEVYYQIENNKLIFRSDKPVEISYRLIGNRYDWQNWPTKAANQTEKGVIVK